MDLVDLFDQINEEHFAGILPRPKLSWNSRLRSSAGRFIPGSRKLFRSRPPWIEIALYLKDEPEALKHIRDTLAHEMIHYWLWDRRRPYGHTEEFYAKMNLMGVSRYNPVPKIKPPKYLYQCPGCEKEFPTKRRLGTLACLTCCKTHTQGRFDSRFKLKLVKELR